MIIAIWVCLQIFLLRRDEVQFLIAELKTQRSVQVLNGEQVIDDIESSRKEVMKKIRDKFKALNDYMVLVAGERNEANEEVNWEQYLLKNRILGKQQVSQRASERLEHPQGQTNLPSNTRRATTWTSYGRLKFSK